VGSADKKNDFTSRASRPAKSFFSSPQALRRYRIGRRVVAPSVLARGALHHHIFDLVARGATTFCDCNLARFFAGTSAGRGGVSARRSASKNFFAKRRNCR
jgi:hypothetical protein